MKITYIVGTLLLLASLALASDPEDPVMRKLRKETTHGLGRGGKRTLETKQRPQTLGRGGKRRLKGAPSSNNDLCVNALALQSFQTGSTVSATVDNVGYCGTHNTAAGVWYTVTGISGPITVDTCNASDFDTKISVFQGSCGGLTCVDGNDDDSSCNFNGLHSSVTWTATASETYYVLVHGFGSNTGEFGLNAAFPPVTNPNPNSCDGYCNTQAPGGCYCDEACLGAGDCCSDVCNECSFLPICDAPSNNDLCVNALPLDDFQTGSTVSATIDYHWYLGTCGTNTAPGVWYTVTGISGQVSVDTCRPETNFDTQISVFRGGSCGFLTCVDGNNDDFTCSLNNHHSKVTWTATASQQYYVLVHGFEDETGEFGLSFEW